MSKPLPVRYQDEILRRYEVLRRGVLRVQCVKATEPLLKAAGVVEPVPFQFYEVPAKLIYGGTKLVLASDAAPGVPVEVPAEPFESGTFDEFGPCEESGQGPGAGVQEEEDAPAGPEDLAELHRVKEAIKEGKPWAPAAARVWEQAAAVEHDKSVVAPAPARRVFEIPIRGEMKARVTVEVFEDDRLPSPGELPKWVPCSKVEDIEVWAAARALSEAREVTDFEVDGTDRADGTNSEN